MSKRKKREQRAARTLSGELHMARNGAGYLIDPATDVAVWIEAKDLSTALPGDIVAVRLGRDGADGRVERVERRAPRSIVGTVTAGAPFARVQPLSPTFRQEFLVPDTRGAAVGDRVVMRLARWENPRLAPEGVVTDVIGPADDPSLDTRAVMEQFDLPASFPRQVRAAAERASARLDEPGRRLDLRRKFIFTCDPASARDFDDALSLETDKNGNRVLGVHIADVSHFVTPGSPLDKEAYRRSTSVYLVDKVVPMLPEQLSNGVCSLMPGEDRLAFSAFLTFDAQGRCVARRFAKSIIRSKVRLTYEQVMAMLKGGAGKRGRTEKCVREISDLAQQLRKRRFAVGALDMDVPEADIRLDAKGMMTGIEVRPYDESHQMVEECMVAANEAVAAELWTRGVKILARLHEPPDPARLEELCANLAGLGISCGDLSQQRNLARFLDGIKGTPLEGVLSVMVLRSMKRALYSAREIGHFGLAKKFYAHFTSPIRRYPDLVLHRQLASFLEGKGGRLDQGWLDRAAQHASEREQAADEAERMLVEIKKYRYMEDVLKNDPGRTFDAVVGKCTPYGVFVDLPDIVVGGMVHVSRLSQSFVRWDAFGEVLTDGRRSWQVGAKMKVRVAAVDFDQRKIDFVTAEQGGGDPKKGSFMKKDDRSSSPKAHSKAKGKDGRARRARKAGTSAARALLACVALACSGTALAAECASPKASTAAKRVLFIGSDGMSAAVLRNADVKAPAIRGLMARGAWSLKARTILPSSSAANWASMFQCSGPELNGYNEWNSRKPVMPPAAVDANGRFPDFFARFRAARPKAKIGYAYGWQGMPFVVDTNVCDFVVHTNAAHKMVLDWIRAEKPDLMAVVFSPPDGAGHTYGWGSPEYTNAVAAVDADIGRVIAAYEEAGILADTFVVFTSDHGGTGKRHGGTSLDEMERPVVFAGPGVKKGYEIPWVTLCPDVGATIAHVLGIPPARVWTGRVVCDIFE